MATVTISNPFKLLSAFAEQDFTLFRGRKSEIDILFQMVMSGNTILLYGDSGVGKTSLVQCGLPHKLSETGSNFIWIRRGKNITASFKSDLIKALGNDSDLNESELNSLSIPKLIKRVYLDCFVPVYLIFDQFEDFFTLTDAEERDHFVNELKQIFLQKISCKFIFIIREEFLGKLDEIKSLVPDLFAHELRIYPLDKYKIENEILSNYFDDKNNGEGTGITCVPDSKTIIKKITEACQDEKENIHLPYLQVFLYKLWEKARAANDGYSIVFTAELIKETGNIGNVLKDYLEECILEIDCLHESEMWAFLNEFTPSERVSQPVSSSEIKTISKDLSGIWIEGLIKHGIINQLPDDQIELAHFSLVSIIREKKPKYKKALNPNVVYEGNPYKGLLSYNEGDENIFFGRQKVKGDLLKKIRNENLVAVVGSSGSGKSSLIKAGILPELKKDGFEIFSIRPGDQPNMALSEIESFLKSNKNPKKIIYIDQFEELTTRCDDSEQRKEFIDFSQLIASSNYSNAAENIKVILSIRADYEYEFISEFKSWKDSKFNVPFFTPDEIIEVITEPAYKAGLMFSPDSLIDKMVNEVMSYSGTLPLLSYALKEMFVEYMKAGKTNKLLEEKEYKKSGGIIEGLKKRADGIFYEYGPLRPHTESFTKKFSQKPGGSIEEKKIKSDDIFYEYKPLKPQAKFLPKETPHQKTIRNLMLRMSSLGINERAAKRVLPDEIDYGNVEENKRVKEVLQKFINKGLIMEGKNQDGTIAFYEPSHDSLVRNWDLIGKWIEQFGKEIIYLQKSLVDAIKSHEIGGPLWHDHANLQALVRIINSESNWMNKKEIEFVKASDKKRLELVEMEKRSSQLLVEKLNEEKRRTSLLKKSRVVFIAALLLLFILSYSLYINWNQEVLLGAKKEKEIIAQTEENKEILAHRTEDSIQNAYVLIKSDSIQELLKLSGSELARYNSLNNLYISKNRMLSDTARAYEKLKFALMIADAKKELRQESFYKSDNATFDSLSKEQLIDKLVMLRFEENNLDDYYKLKTSLNKISAAKNEEKTNPNTALMLMKQAYDIYPTKMIDTITLKMINFNLFYNSKFEIVEKRNATRSFESGSINKIAISTDKSIFALLTNSGIRTGQIKNGNIIVDNDLLANMQSLVSSNNFNRPSYITSLDYTTNNTLIAVTNDNKIYKWQEENSIPIVKNIPKSINDSIYYLTAITADGKKLIRDYNDLYIKVYDVENIENNLPDIWDKKFDTAGGYILNIIPAPFEHKALVTNKNYKCWLIDIDSNSSNLIGNANIYSACFTPQGKNIVYETRDSLVMCDLKGVRVGAFLKNLGSYTRYASGKISISSDWKTLAFQNANTGHRYFENYTGNQKKDSLFFFGTPNSVNIKNNSISSSMIIGFIDNTSLLSYQKSVYPDSISSLLMLKTHPIYNDFPTAFNSIHPYLTERDSIRIGLGQPTENEKYENVLRFYNYSFDNSLSQSLKKDYLIKAKQLLADLLLKHNDNDDYLATLKSIDRNLFAIDSNFNDYTKDIKRYIAIEKRCLEKYSNDTLNRKYLDYKRALAFDYGNLSFWLIFVDSPDFSEVIKTAETGLIYDSTVDFIHTNRALGYLLDKDTIKAKGIYSFYRRKFCETLNKNFKKSFLEDLDDIERRNIVTKKDEELYNLVQRIKCFLKDEGCSL